jgi:hypothetical protein
MQKKYWTSWTNGPRREHGELVWIISDALFGSGVDGGEKKILTRKGRNDQLIIGNSMQTKYTETFAKVLL